VTLPAYILISTWCV